MVNQLLSSTLVACGGPQYRLFATTSFSKMGGDGFRILREEDHIELKTKKRSFLIRIDCKIGFRFNSCSYLSDHHGPDFILTSMVLFDFRSFQYFEPAKNFSNGATPVVSSSID